MSGKKVKAGNMSPGGAAPFWVSCSACGIMLPRSVSVTHLENSCNISYPFIRNQIAHITINEVPFNSRILELPFINTRHSGYTIFLSKEIITACGFMSFEWILLKRAETCDDKHSTLIDNVPLAFRVWPIPDMNSITRNCSGALVTESLMKGIPFNITEGSFTLENMNPPSNPFNKLPSLKQALLLVSCHDDKDVIIPDDEKNRVIQNFRRAFKNRAVTHGNIFRLQFYSLVLDVHVLIRSKFQDEWVGDLLKHLSLDNTTSLFYEITNESEFTLEIMDSRLPRTDQEKQITLAEVGGLVPVTEDLSSTIKYIFESCKDPGRSSLSAGILLYGHHGTGKSLLVQALCTELQLNSVQYQEHGSKSSSRKNEYSTTGDIKDIFATAIRNLPCAVVIENLDVVGTKTSRSESNISFVNQLRSEIEKVNCLNVEIIVLATCTDIEAVDTSLRAPHIFGKEIEIPVPALSQREDILHKLIGPVKHNLSAGDIKHIASMTHGYVGADLKSLVAQSYLHARRRVPSTSSSISLQDIEDCIKIVHPSAMKSILIDVPNVRWEDIGGQKDLKFKLKQAIEWPLKHPESFKRLGITPPKGILMYGPPGCSKTMIAKAIATESGLNFISVKGSELFSKWVGESEKAVRSLFRKARQVSPCIIFFDEIDSLGGERGSSSGGASNVHERVLAQLLIEIDGIEALKDVTIVAATNRPDIIDPALLRPGRLDRIIHVPLPDEDTRREIFNIHFRRMPVSPEVDVQRLVKVTDRYSGAELTAVCHEAALKALEQNIESTVILESHFFEALALITPRTSLAQIEFYEKFSQSRLKKS